MRAYNFFVCGPNFAEFFLFNVGGIVVDQVCFRLLISRSALEIFGVKVQSCPKSRQIFYVFALPNFWGAGPHKICTQIIMAALRHVTWESLVGLRPLSPKL